MLLTTIIINNLNKWFNATSSMNFVNTNLWIISSVVPGELWVKYQLCVFFPFVSVSSCRQEKNTNKSSSNYHSKYFSAISTNEAKAQSNLVFVIQIMKIIEKIQKQIVINNDYIPLWVPKNHQLGYLMKIYIRTLIAPPLHSIVNL